MRADYPADAVKGFLAEKYGVVNITDMHRFESGLENTNYYVETPKNQYVFKVYEELELPSIEFELSYIDECYKQGLPVQKIIKSNAGEIISQFNSKPCVLLYYLEGKNFRELELTPELAKKVGKLLADFAIKTKDCNPKGRIVRKHFWDVYQFLVNEPFVDEITDVPKDFVIDAIKEFKEMKPLIDKCRKGIIHNDFNIENILLKNNEITGVIDFGDAIKTIIVTDIVVPLTQICYAQDDSLNKCAMMFKEYNKHFPLNDVEKEVLFTLMKARFATCILHPSHMNTNWGKHRDFDYYIQLGYKGLQEMKKLGKEKFNSALGI